jgi:hypothetical protein
MTTKHPVYASRGSTAPSWVTIDSDGTARIGSLVLGRVEYSAGFSRYVAYASNGKIKHFNGDLDTAPARAARWLAKQGW